MLIPLPREKSRIVRGVILARVLVVDAEPLIRWSICTALEAEGFEAISAPDAAVALQVAANWPPKVVLFDLKSSDSSGLQVLSAIEALSPDCRFIVMTTARDWPPDMWLAEGVELTRKPFDINELVQLVIRLATRESQVRGCAGKRAS